MSAWEAKFGPAQPFFPPSLAGNFDSGTALFTRRTFHVSNLMHKLSELL